MAQQEILTGRVAIQLDDGQTILFKQAAGIRLEMLPDPLDLPAILAGERAGELYVVTLRFTAQRDQDGYQMVITEGEQ